MKAIKVFSILLCLALLAGCGTPQEPSQPTKGTEGNRTPTDSSSTAKPDADFADGDDEMFTQRDFRSEYSEGSAIRVRLNGSTASCDSPAVKIDGRIVTVLTEGVYVFTGTLEDGQIVVNAGEKDKVQLVLEGITVTSLTSAPLLVLEGDKVFVTLKDGTENCLTSGESFAEGEYNIDGAVFSKQDLTFNGGGSLTVESTAGHAIVCKDDLVFTGGSYTLNAAYHGLDANDSVRITGAKLTIDAGKDGIHCENADDVNLGFFYMSGGAVDVEAEGDGISAGAYAQIEAGTIQILAGGGSENGNKTHSGGYGDFMGGGPGGRPGGPGGKPGGRATGTTQTAAESDSSSMKGIKASGNLRIGGGNIQIDSADDTLHANGCIVIDGGVLKLKSGDDGVHADDTLTINATTMEITECYEGLEAEKVYVKGGSIRLKATDDGINAAGGTDSSGSGGRDQMFGGGGPWGGMGGSSNGYIEISGGELYINSSGDGMDANGSFLISGGYTIIVGPTTGDTATLDYDVEGKITGGTFIGTGASGMAQSFSSSEQGVIAVSVGNAAAGTEITVTDPSGKRLITHSPELPYAVVIISTPEIQKGTTYAMTVGTASGNVEAS